MPGLATGRVTLSFSACEGEPLLDALMHRKLEQAGRRRRVASEVSRMQLVLPRRMR
jgi:hypothetical protein